MYEYKAALVKVVDGDTIRVNLDLGCDVAIRLTLRLARINAPELRTSEGVAAKEWLVEKLADKALYIKTHKDRREKYGRYLADLFLYGDDEVCLNDLMVEQGHASYTNY